MKIFFTLLTLVFGSLSGMAQEYERGNSSPILLFTFSYGIHLPGGDLSERFRNHTSLGFNTEFMTTDDKNWIMGVEGNFHFGNTVKEDVLTSLEDDQGFIIGNNRAIADIRLRQRGFYTGIYAGKLIPLSKMNKRSGIRLTLGTGLFQHKIRIQDDPNSFVPGLGGDYKKGYDRLSNGIALTEFIGYQILSTNRLINVALGFEFTQAFTQSRRDWDFDLMAKDTRKRTDLVFGFRLSWTLPYYLGESAEIYY